MPQVGLDVARGLESLRRVVAEVLLAERPVLAAGSDLPWLMSADAATGRAG